VNNCRVGTCKDFGTLKKEYKDSTVEQFRCIAYRQTSVKLAHLRVWLNKKAKNLTTLYIGNEIIDE